MALDGANELIPCREGTRWHQHPYTRLDIQEWNHFINSYWLLIWTDSSTLKSWVVHSPGRHSPWEEIREQRNIWRRRRRILCSLAQVQSLGTLNVFPTLVLQIGHFKGHFDYTRKVESDSFWATHSMFDGGHLYKGQFTLNSCLIRYK